MQTFARISIGLALVFLLVMYSVPSAVSQDDEGKARTVPTYRLSPAELELWNDPAFQQAFTRSYIAETEIEPTVTLPEREAMQEILELISSDQLEQAEIRLKELQTPEASAVIDFTLANIYFQTEQLDEAVSVYQTAVEKYPKFRRAWKNLALIHVRQGDFDEALPALTRVVELGGSDALTYGLLGFAYGSVENHLSAESAYRMAILLDPETLDWKMGLARSFFKQERFAEASALCRQLISEYPERTDLWMLQANAYIGLNQPLKAAENYEILDSMGGSTTDTLNMLGDIYVNAELYELAADSYLRAFSMEPMASIERAIRSAKILVARGAFPETRNLIEEMELRAGENMSSESWKELLKVKARLAVASGEGDEEVDVLKQIIEIDPLDGEALILLGQHSNRTGDAEKAIFYFERAANIEGFEANAKVQHAQVLVSRGNYAEALPLLRQAQLINPRENVQNYLEQVERIAKTG